MLKNFKKVDKFGTPPLYVFKLNELLLDSDQLRGKMSLKDIITIINEIEKTFEYPHLLRIDICNLTNYVRQLIIDVRL